MTVTVAVGLQPSPLPAPEVTGRRVAVLVEPDDSVDSAPLPDSEGVGVYSGLVSISSRV